MDQYFDDDEYWLENGETERPAGQTMKKIAGSIGRGTKKALGGRLHW